MGGLTIGFRILAEFHSRGAAPKAPKTGFPCPLPRRMSKLSNGVLYCVAQLAETYGEGVFQLPTVYASRYGELDRTHELLEEWRSYGEMSPAGFSLSVHNATATLLSLACKNHCTSTTISAGENSLSMGFLEACLLSKEHGCPCLFLYGDSHPDLQFCAMVIEHTTEEQHNVPNTIKELSTI